MAECNLQKINGGVDMNELKIQALQNQLNHMIDNNVDFNKIYELSLELDILIVQYYNKVLNNRETN